MTRTSRLAVLAIVAATACSGEGGADADRQSEVAARGADVMPFDLDATTHVFEKTADGGIQQVLADEDDPVQVRLIREHLGEEAARFESGDFHDPEMIHGAEMPGLHDLVQGHDRLVIEYREIERGAEILYSSADADLVSALHLWFDAQVSDHGEHAQAREEPSLGSVAWLIGCWIAGTGDSYTEEVWLPARGGLMIGASRTISGGVAVAYEFVRLHERDGNLTYSAHPSGQQPADFQATDVGQRTVRFENPAHDFPQKIEYRATRPDSLLASVFAGAIDTDPSFQVRYERASCGV